MLDRMDRRALLGLATAAVATPALAGGGGGGAKSGYLPVPTVTATLVRMHGDRGVLTVETGIDTSDAMLYALAQQALPRLRAAYAEIAQRAAAGLRPGLAPDVDRLASELQTATDAALGRRGGRLLLGTVMAI